MSYYIENSPQYYVWGIVEPYNDHSHNAFECGYNSVSIDAGANIQPQFYEAFSAPVLPSISEPLHPREFFIENKR